METQQISALTPSIFMEQYRQYLTTGMKWCHQIVATLPCHHFLRANGKLLDFALAKSSINGYNWGSLWLFKSSPWNPWHIFTDDPS